MRQIASPNPIPYDFVVRNAVNMLSNLCGSIPGPEFFYCNRNCIAITKLSCHSQHSTSISRGVHCFDRVADQVKDDLSQLTPVAVNGRKFG